jgi:hypothetical protein
LAADVPATGTGHMIAGNGASAEMGRTDVEAVWAMVLTLANLGLSAIFLCGERLSQASG